MRRVIIKNASHIYPFNEPARNLRVHNKPLWLLQRDALSPYVADEMEFGSLEEAQDSTDLVQGELLICRDNQFFNAHFLDEFIAEARAGKEPRQAAFRTDDLAVSKHVLPLARSLNIKEDLVFFDMWYLPQGMSQLAHASPLVIDSESREVGYYNVPTYMASFTGDLTYHLPRKAFVSLESWFHLFVIDILCGVFARGKDMEEKVEKDWMYRLRVLFKAMVEQKQVLDCSEMVHIGRNVSIDPSAVIHGPTTIGDNVTIGAGVVIDNCLIGDNVNISQGCQLMLSVVGDGCFLPFRASLFMSTLMENTIIAQNTCLQMCVIGRDTFIGAGSTFTDFKVLPGTVSVADGSGRLVKTKMPVLGGCVGHHCRLSSGFIIYPARTIESDVILLADSGNQFITEDIRYEQGIHESVELEEPFPRLYPRQS